MNKEVSQKKAFPVENKAVHSLQQLLPGSSYSYGRHNYAEGFFILVNLYVKPGVEHKSMEIGGCVNLVAEQ